MLLAEVLPTPTKDEFWPVLISLFAILGIVAKALELWTRVNGIKVSGHLQTSPSKEHAEKKELDALTATVNAMRGEITAQFRAAQVAGEARVSAITQSIDEEIGAMGGRIGSLAEALHDKINHTREVAVTNREAINNLKAADNRHDAQVAGAQARIADIQTKIAELMQSHPRRKT